MLSLTWALNTAVQALQGPGSRAASGADQHPFLTPRYREPGFPAAAQFLDSQWEKARLGGQHRGTQSGLRPVSPDHLLHIEPACYVEQMRQKAVLVGGHRNTVTASLHCRLDAQAELLEVVLDIVAKHHTEHFSLTPHTVQSTLTGEIFR